MDWIERWVLYWVRESTLWPVLVVMVGHVVALGAPLMIWSVRDGSWASAATLAGLAALSAAGVRTEIRARQRPGALTGLVLASWLLTAGGAWLADRTGIF